MSKRNQKSGSKPNPTRARGAVQHVRLAKGAAGPALPAAPAAAAAGPSAAPATAAPAVPSVADLVAQHIVDAVGVVGAKRGVEWRAKLTQGEFAVAVTVQTSRLLDAGEYHAACGLAYDAAERMTLIKGSPVRVWVRCGGYLEAAATDAPPIAAAPAPAPAAAPAPSSNGAPA